MKRPIPSKSRSIYICPTCRWPWNACDCAEKCCAPSARSAPLLRVRGVR